MDKPFIYICDNCGTEDPPLVNPGKSHITACCGYGVTGIWKDGWGKRLMIIGQDRIDYWRKMRKDLTAEGGLPIIPWSTKGHYDI